MATGSLVKAERTEIDALACNILGRYAFHARTDCAYVTWLARAEFF
jgi:hypothetical protein